MRIAAPRPVLFLTGLAIVLAAIVVANLNTSPLPSGVRSAIEAPVSACQDAPGSPMDTTLFRDIARRQNPVVVAIMTQSRIETAAPLPDNDEFFRWFFRCGRTK